MTGVFVALEIKKEAKKPPFVKVEAVV